MDVLIAATEIERSCMKISPPTSPASSSHGPLANFSCTFPKNYQVPHSSPVASFAGPAILRCTNPEAVAAKSENIFTSQHSCKTMNYGNQSVRDSAPRESVVEGNGTSSNSFMNHAHVISDSYSSFPSTSNNRFPVAVSTVESRDNTVYHQIHPYASVPSDPRRHVEMDSRLSHFQHQTSTFPQELHSQPHNQHHPDRVDPLSSHIPTGLAPLTMSDQPSEAPSRHPPRSSYVRSFQFPFPEATFVQTEPALPCHHLPVNPQNPPHNSETVPLASAAHLRAARSAASEAILALGTRSEASFALAPEIIKATQLAEAPRRGDRVLPGGADTSVAACYMLGGTTDDELRCLLDRWNLAAPRSSRVKMAESEYKDRVKDLIASLNERGTRESRAENLAALRVCEVIADILDGHAVRSLVNTMEVRNQRIADLQSQVAELQRQLDVVNGSAGLPTGSNVSSVPDAHAITSTSMTS